jgi:hypothetical protein
LEGDEIFLLVDGDYAVAAHDGPDASQVGMPALEIEGGDFEVILGAHHAGSLQAEDAAGGVGGVSVRVWRAAGDEKGDAAANFVRFVVERPSQGPIDAEDGLVVFAVKVGKRDAMESRHDEFEKIEDAAGFVAGLKESNAHLADGDRFVHSHLR